MQVRNAHFSTVEAMLSSEEEMVAAGPVASTMGSGVPYMVTHLLGNNLPFTWFQQFWQLMGRYCSGLLPRQDGGTFKIQVNRRFLPSRSVTL